MPRLTPALYRDFASCTVLYCARGEDEKLRAHAGVVAATSHLPSALEFAIEKAARFENRRVEALARVAKLDVDPVAAHLLTFDCSWQSRVALLQSEEEAIVVVVG